jgi:hypothetical protein
MKRNPWLDLSTPAQVPNSIEAVRVCFRELQQYGRHALRWYGRSLSSASGVSRALYECVQYELDRPNG